MKVNIDITLVVEDDVLIRLADVLDGKISRRKAKRDEVKAFVWKYGERWEYEIQEQWVIAFGSDTPVEDEGDDEDDLLGGADEPETDEDDDLLGTGGEDSDDPESLL